MASDDAVQEALSRVTAFVEAGAARRARLLLVQLHPADQADVVGRLDDEIRQVLLDSLLDADVAAMLEYLDEDLQVEVLGDPAGRRIISVLAGVPDDLAAYVIRDLPDEVREPLLERLGDSKVEELVGYEEATAGGRMSGNMVILHDFWTVERAIEFLRRAAVDLRAPMHLFVVDDYDELVGTITPGHMVMYPGRVRLDQIMDANPITVPLDYDQEEAAERMRRYNLLALPVVDAERHVRGVLTADEILDIQVEEATEDIYHLAGLGESERIFRPTREAVPPRLAWLSFNLLTAFAGALTINFFEGTIERVATLAVFMPLVAGMAGNAGLQTLTLVVRSIALGEIEPRDAARVLAHELAIAAINGVAIGVTVGLIAWLWKDSAWLGIIVGFALLANIVNAMVGGVMVPVLLKRLKSDPALASGVIVMLSDAVGFLLLLGMATLLITRID